MLLEVLQKQSGLRMGQLQRIAQTASKRYKIYPIDKRMGGTRIIAHPSKELKAIQRWINKFLFKSFPIHNNATAYKRGASIKKNADRHVRTSFTLRLDFKDFFPSFSDYSISHFLHAQNVEREIGLSDADINFVCAIATRHGQLTIGSPASPVITNVMMYDFDTKVSLICASRSLVYTRYADDLFVSSSEPNKLDGLVDEIENIAKNYCHVKLRLNRGKIAFLSKRYRRSITGLVITTDQKVSLGRDRKREIKSLVFKYANDELNDESVSRLQGLVAFSMDADKAFYERLITKYGEDIIKRILRQHGPT